MKDHRATSWSGGLGDWRCGPAGQPPWRASPGSRSSGWDGAFLPNADAVSSPSFDAKPGDCLDIKQFQDLQDRILRVAEEDATVSDHPG